MWTKISDTELAASSDLIASAKLLGTTQLQSVSENRFQRIGILETTKVYKGEKTTRYILLNLPAMSQPRLSTDIDYREGTSGIWFLREDGETKGIFHADNPQRLWPHDKSPVVEKLVQP